MTDESWENGLRDVMAGAAGTARVAPPPTDVILRKGRSSLRRRNGLAGSGVLGVVAAAVMAGTSLTGSAGGSVPSGTTAAASTATSAPRLPQAADAVVTMGPASAKTKVVLYEDYRCPMCKDLNTGLEATLREFASEGKIQIEYRPTDLIDRNERSLGNGSVVAGNAVICAAHQGDFYAYRDAVYAHQPSESTDPFTAPAQLIEIGREVPGLVTTAFKTCVEGQPYATAISHNYDTAINTQQCEGMPCVIAAGQRWQGSVLEGQDYGTAVGFWLARIISTQ